MAAGRLMIRTSYRLSASIGGLWLVAGSVVLILLTPASGLFWAGSGAFILGIGMGSAIRRSLSRPRRASAGAIAACYLVDNIHAHRLPLDLEDTPLKAL
jgi:hypothetical protein